MQNIYVNYGIKLKINRFVATTIPKKYDLLLKICQKSITQWQNPEQREKMSEIKKIYHKENPESGRIQGDKLKTYYEENPQARIIISEKVKEHYNIIENREKNSERQKKRFENPEEVEKARERAKKNWANPEQREKMSEIIKRYYKKNPEAIEKMSERMKKHLQENPDAKYNRLNKLGKNKSYDVFKLDGTFIKTFNYQIDAQKYLQKEYNIHTRIPIGEVLSGKRKSANGFVFKYKENENI
jgi:hypothetical protein